MPNIKSAIKRVTVNKKKNEENKSIKTVINTYTKKFKEAIAQKKFDDAKVLLSEVFSCVDTAAKDNVIHASSAARRKAHLSKLLADATK